MESLWPGVFVIGIGFEIAAPLVSNPRTYLGTTRVAEVTPPV
jgi:hypothetical protein